jgi:hypothetical protein
MAFWTSDLFDPKVNFRFKVLFRDTSGGYEEIWYASKADQPSLTITTAQARFLRHKFNFPTSYEWGEVEVVLVDPKKPLITSKVMKQLSDVAFQHNEFKSMSKTRFLKQFNLVKITSLKSDGKEGDSWTLNGAFPINVTFSSFDYSNENLTEIKIKFKYDFAKFEDENGVVYDPVGAQITTSQGVAQMESVEVATEATTAINQAEQEQNQTNQQQQTQQQGEQAAESTTPAEQSSTEAEPAPTDASAEPTTAPAPEPAPTDASAEVPSQPEVESAPTETPAEPTTAPASEEGSTETPTPAEQPPAPETPPAEIPAEVPSQPEAEPAPQAPAPAERPPERAGPIRDFSRDRPVERGEERWDVDHDGIITPGENARRERLDPSYVTGNAEREESPDSQPSVPNLEIPEGDASAEQQRRLDAISDGTDTSTPSQTVVVPQDSQGDMSQDLNGDGNVTERERDLAMQLDLAQQGRRNQNSRRNRQ